MFVRRVALTEIGIAIVDADNTILVEATLNAIAGADGTIYAVGPVEGVVTKAGRATASVVVLVPGLVKVKTQIEYQVDVLAGMHVTLAFRDDVVIKIQGSVVDPLEIEPLRVRS